MILFAMSVSESNTASLEHVPVSVQYACRYLDPFPNEDINTFFVIVLDIICSTTNRSYLVRFFSTTNKVISTVQFVFCGSLTSCWHIIRFISLHLLQATFIILISTFCNSGQWIAYIYVILR